MSHQANYNFNLNLKYFIGHCAKSYAPLCLDTAWEGAKIRYFEQGCALDLLEK